MQSFQPDKGDPLGAMKVVNKMMEEDQVIEEKMEPSDVVGVEIRIREGKGYKGDEFEVDGERIYIPQLSYSDLRKAIRESMKLLDGSSLGKKVVKAMKTGNDDEDVGDVSFTEWALIDEVNVTRDLWLVFLALKEVGHSKISGDFDEDKKFIDYLPNLAELMEKIKRFNGISPEGEDEVKFFRDDRSRSSDEV
jgi:hypothetical protein